ncbi:DUF4012 domain-containing protein [Nocardioides litoris]|uniref:DUF4012 domain-containing protein n=1 Tax=Nocardioides litoris TaxID=1926648 RepID=UPI00111D23B3|nr:DUF4012 domain-containing protein [Nocardioides litoris]
MLTRRRVVAAVVLLLLAAVAYTIWLLYAAQRDLRAAEDDARALQSAIEAGDTGQARTALAALQDSAGAARNDTDGPWWSVMTLFPSVGDDLEGVRGVSASLDEIAGTAGPRLLDLEDGLAGVVTDGQVDLDALSGITDGVLEADASAGRALGEVADLDTSGYSSLLQGPVDEYVDQVSDLRSTLAGAATAARVAPTMLGADGPRDYLVVFQNNAEVRSTGGLSGAWARIHTEDGKIGLREQGSAGDFPVADPPLVEVSAEEEAVYGDVIARYFQDPVMVPDFPRAAQLFDAFWQEERPGGPEVDLDGVVSIDTVGLSYLLRATDPITSDGYTLTPDTAVQLLLNQVYRDIDDPARQDEVFAGAASAVFAAATTGTTSPRELVRAVDQAVGERRLMIASFEDEVQGELAGTRVAAELSGDDGATPHVDVTVNDATGSKMSYYLDHDTQVRATGCEGGVQQLAGTMTLRQTIPEAEAAQLPRYITGGGVFGVKPGTQQVLVRLYAPYGGELGKVTVDGVEVPRFTVATIDDRQVITLAIATNGSADVPIEFAMTSGTDQDGAGVVQTTPRATTGSSDSTFPSAC